MLVASWVAKSKRMTKGKKDIVIMSGGSQAVRVPAEFRFNKDEVYVRRDQQSGDLILSQATGDWNSIFDALDAVGVPEDFLADRRQQPSQRRRVRF